jgi:hypothetical protein
MWLPAQSAVFCWRVDNLLRFPEFCTTSEKWFRRPPNCFIRARRTKHFEKKINDFNELKNWSIEPAARRSRVQ